MNPKLNTNLSHKFLLVLLSLSLIFLGSGSIKTVLFLIVFTSLSYWNLKYICMRIAHKNIKLVLLLLYVGSFLYLQQNNYIGVVSAANQASPQTVVLLMGFAFYFLQVLSLMLGVIRKEIKLPPYLDFLLATVYFPKFFSGPIEPIGFMNTVAGFRFLWDDEKINKGIAYVTGGIFFKHIIATHLQKLVNLDEISSPLLIMISTVSFELQVYFDFCGYSLMAYGIAQAVGLPIMLNFNHPFGSANVPEFWHRWHIGLGRWFYDNVFEPLKPLYSVPAWRRICLPMLVFLLSAMWHGLTLNFLIWGLFHGASFVGFVWLANKITIPPALARIHLFATLIIGRFFFMDLQFDRLLQKLSILFNPNAWLTDFNTLQTLLASQYVILGKQGAVVILITASTIGYEILYTSRNPDLKYSVIRHEIVFVMLAITTFVLFPVSVQNGFVYGR